MDKAHIYALTEPSGEVRYIGKAVNVAARLYDHFARDGDGTHKSNWLRKLLRLGQHPGVLIVEECPEEAWQDRERYWIAEYRRRGAKLTNATDGGEGGGCASPEGLARIGAASKVRIWTPEAREKLRKANLGKVVSKETRAKQAQAKLGNDHRSWFRKCRQRTAQAPLGTD